MQQGGKNTVFQAVGSSVCALLLTAAIYFAGTGLGNALLQLQKSYRIEFFNRAVAGQDAVVRMVESEKLHTVATQYLRALMDSVIRFEFFPRQQEGETFLAVISALPEEVEIDRFEFTERHLLIYGHCTHEEQLKQFQEALSDAPCFQDVLLESCQKKDGSYAGVLTCITV
ncbi:MAG: hypothetical protein HFG27_07255 [Provencibacterium sp.]|jgi:hypothetical protein|nr:hypothetical protein [Provencibacterium sp.]